MYDDIGIMMEAQLAVMRPWSAAGIKAARISAGLKGQKKLPIQLSHAACLWLSRKTIGVRSVG